MVASKLGSAVGGLRVAFAVAAMIVGVSTAATAACSDCRCSVPSVLAQACYTETPSYTGCSGSTGGGAAWSSTRGMWMLGVDNSSYVEVTFDVDDTSEAIYLCITYLSAPDVNCPNGGDSPVDVLLNGYYVVSNRSPMSHTWSFETWHTAGRVFVGANVVRIQLKNACSPCGVRCIQIGSELPVVNRDWIFLAKSYEAVLAGSDPALRDFRDQYLRALPGGDTLVSAFYAALPLMAELAGRDPLAHGLGWVVVAPSSVSAEYLVSAAPMPNER